jgi:hypothetical protein
MAGFGTMGHLYMGGCDMAAAAVAAAGITGQGMQLHATFHLTIAGWQAACSAAQQMRR